MMQTLTALLAWGVFGFLWIAIFLKAPAEETARGAGAGAVLLVGSLIATMLWVRHAEIMGERHAGRRQRSADPRKSWTHDAVGRPLSGPRIELIQTAREVEIDTDLRSGKKVYRVF